MKRLIPLLAAGVVALAACGPEFGTVEDKRYEPGYSIYHPGYYTTTCGSFNSKGQCTSRIRIWNAPWTQWVPDSWNLYLRDGEDEGWVEVPEPIWQGCLVGQYYSEGRCS